LNEKLKSLQRKLDKAVAEEDFEQAVAVRDEIKTTKDKLQELKT
jgi:protein-arginine kinase activator protein McsA